MNKVLSIALITLTALLGTAFSASEEDRKEEAVSPPPTEHPVVFWELASHDAEASASFFHKVFGWQSRLDEKSGIHHVATRLADGTGVNGGIFTLSRARLPFVAVYVPVTDIQAKVKEIEAAGGLIVNPPERFGNYQVCLFNEPSGVTFAMIQTDPPEADARTEKAPD